MRTRHDVRARRGSVARRQWVLALALGSVTSTAAAQSTTATPAAQGATTAATDARFEEGRALRRARRDSEALTHFEALYRDAHEPRALAQVALAEAALGRWVVAEAHLAEALAHPDAWIDANRTAGVNLGSQVDLIAQHLASLEVISETSGAEVWIAGARAASLPMARPLRVEVGRVTYELRAPGHATAQREVTLAASERVRETVTLTATARAVSPVHTEPAAPTRSNTTRTLAWVGVGGAALLLGAGVATWVVASSAADRWNDDATCLRPGMTRAQVCGDELDTARTMNAVAVVGFVGGAALAGVSAALFALSSRGEQSPGAHASVTCGVGPGAVGVACAGVF